MKVLYDFFPVVLFFLSYKFYGHLPQGALNQVNAVLPLGLQAGHAEQAIYLATAVGILATAVQVFLYRLLKGRFERMHLISLSIFLIAGGATLILRNPVFVYWKPTILNGLFAVIFLSSQFIGDKTIIERLLSQAVQAPLIVWRRLNLAWVGYFIVLGATNLFVAYHFSEGVWVNFKLFGWLGLTVAFIVLQALYLSRYATDENPHSGKPS